ncbi:MAG: hypothetical protein RLZZ602_901, partial [Pseudomonadota bacterium]
MNQTLFLTAETAVPSSPWWARPVVGVGSDRPFRFDVRLFWIFQILFWVTSTLSLKVMIKTLLPVDDANVIILGRILTGLVMTTLLHFA